MKNYSNLEYLLAVMSCERKYIEEEVFEAIMFAVIRVIRERDCTEGENEFRAVSDILRQCQIQSENPSAFEIYTMARQYVESVEMEFRCYHVPIVRKMNESADRFPLSVGFID